jgi:hypothetical protein
VKKWISSISIILIILFFMEIWCHFVSEAPPSALKGDLNNPLLVAA